MGCQCTKNSDDLDIKIDKKEKEKESVLDQQKPNFLGDYKFDGKTPKNSQKINYEINAAESTLYEAKMIDDGIYSDTPNNLRHGNMKSNISDASLERSTNNQHTKSASKIILREGKQCINKN